MINNHKFIFFVCFLLCFSACTKNPRIYLNSPERKLEAVDAYLAEFSTQSFMDSTIGPAIRDVMLRMPEEALNIVMDRRRPVLFVEVHSSGTARFASSSEVIVTKNEAPAFKQGMTLIKLSDALAGGSLEAIKGIVAHEIAHRVLDHIRNNHVNCQAEREANQLIKSWGFTKEFEAASKEFGQSKVGDGIAGCQEVSE